MTTERNDGGPAFPVIAEQYDYGYERVMPKCVEPGMSMRDFFAAQAMVGIFQMIASGAHSVNVGDIEGGIAQQAYDMADAMLKQRNSQ